VNFLGWIAAYRLAPSITSTAAMAQAFATAPREITTVMPQAWQRRVVSGSRYPESADTTEVTR
jgi:hypothetical protein